MSKRGLETLVTSAIFITTPIWGSVALLAMALVMLFAMGWAFWSILQELVADTIRDLTESRDSV